MFRSAWALQQTGILLNFRSREWALVWPIRLISLRINWREKMVRTWKVVLVGLLGIVVLGGCMGTPRVTDPARTAIEQLLLSTAAERALIGVDLKVLEGKKVFLDASGFEGTDKAYAIGQIKILLGKQGALFVEDKKQAEVVVEVTSGALSVDRSDSLFGIPPIPVPVPNVGTFETPEVAMFKTIKQTGVAKFAMNVYEPATGKQVLAIGPTSGTTYHNFHRMFFLFKFYRTDLPEKKKDWWKQP